MSPKEGDQVTVETVMNDLRTAVFELYQAADRLDEAIARKVQEREGDNSDAR